MSRIDGLFNVLAVVPYAVVVLLAARSAPDRSDRLRCLAIFLGPVVSLVAVGLLDLRLLASKYFHDLGSQLRLIAAAAVVVLVLAVVVVAVLSDIRRGWTGRLGRAPGQGRPQECCSSSGWRSWRLAGLVRRA